MSSAAVSVPVEETATARWRRRRAILEVLDPTGRSSYQNLDFAVDLAFRHKWNVAPASLEHAKSIARTRTILTPPIVGDRECAVFFHEAGHIEDGTPRDVEQTLKAEFRAWQFAMGTLGRRWNSTMNVYMEDCLRSYQEDYVKSYDDLVALNAVVAEGAELARHVVKISTSGRNAR